MRIWILLFFTYFTISCEDKSEEISIIDYENISLNCLFMEDSEFIIKSESEYINMAQMIFNDRIFLGQECADTLTSQIDFNKYVLLGKYVSWDTNDKLETSVVEDKLNKRIIYKLELDEVEGPDTGGGFGKTIFSSMNWILVSLPDGYDILIEFKKH